LVKKNQVKIKFSFPQIWSAMEINEYSEMIQLYNIKPSNSFHYYSHSWPPILPTKHPLSKLFIKQGTKYTLDIFSVVHCFILNSNSLIPLTLYDFLSPTTLTSPKLHSTTWKFLLPIICLLAPLPMYQTSSQSPPWETNNKVSSLWCTCFLQPDTQLAYGFLLVCSNIHLPNDHVCDNWNDQFLFDFHIHALFVNL